MRSEADLPVRHSVTMDRAFDGAGGAIVTTTLPRAPRILLVLLAAALLGGVTIRARAANRRAALLRADIEAVLADPVLRAAALPEGRRIYVAHCATCHGATGKGGSGVPDLTDDDHLYELSGVGQIEEIARFGIRAANKRGWALAAMPVYASQVPYRGEPLPSLTPAEIEDLVQSVLWFTGRATDIPAAKRGRILFEGKAGCWDCHGRDAAGDAAIGAPMLTDDVWLYGGDHDTIYRSIAHGRAGYSPAFGRVLSPLALREVALYTASLAPLRGRAG